MKRVLIEAQQSPVTYSDIQAAFHTCHQLFRKLCSLSLPDLSGASQVSVFTKLSAAEHQLKFRLREADTDFQQILADLQEALDDVTVKIQQYQSGKSIMIQEEADPTICSIIIDIQFIIQRYEFYLSLEDPVTPTEWVTKWYTQYIEQTKRMDAIIKAQMKTIQLKVIYTDNAQTILNTP
ncbi:hypothetical protein LQZ19_00400 [Treponema primitia]|uniref:hypothetical protein n=1 Tax=Treponema primitia TaxID=88058 RepID=UPI00397F2272